MEPRPELPAPVVATESHESGVQRVAEILAVATHARWPMYLRNVKQILRSSNGGFDERRYGFGGLMDLLKACQRAGLVRIERDRRGGLRVFQGSALQAGVVTRTAHGALPQPDIEDTLETAAPVESSPGGAAPPAAEHPAETEPLDLDPIPIDTTAELLGRAKPKPRARTRSATPAVARAAREGKGATRATPRRTRAKKPAGANDEPE
jgi:hypothetical protein